MKLDKELESMFQSIWEELTTYAPDDIVMNRIRAKLKKIQVKVTNLK